MTRSAYFNKFLSRMKPLNPTLIEAIQEARSLIESESDDSVELEDANLNEKGGFAKFIVTIPWEQFPEQRDKIAQLVAKNTDIDLEEFLSETKIKVSRKVAGTMVKEGDYHGNWAWFEIADEKDSYQISTPAGDVQVEFGAGYDDVLKYALISTENKFSDMIDGIGESTYEKKPNNRFAYGAEF